MATGCREGQEKALFVVGSGYLFLFSPQSSFFVFQEGGSSQLLQQQQQQQCIDRRALYRELTLLRV